MQLSMRLLILLTAAACLSTLVTSASEVRRKQQRPTRGFKNVEMMTARGFGKRGRPTRAEPYWSEDHAPPRRRFDPKTTLLVAPDFGKRSSEDMGEAYGMENFWETLEASPERQSLDGEDRTVESIPLDWFVNEVLNNPTFARSVVRKFVDLNQDGVLSSDELLRNTV